MKLQNPLTFADTEAQIRGIVYHTRNKDTSQYQLGQRAGIQRIFRAKKLERKEIWKKFRLSFFISVHQSDIL